MSDFQPGDTVRFRIDDGDGTPEKVGWYAGVLSLDGPRGWLRIDGDDFTEHPEGYRPSGWLVVRDGEPYSHLIKDLTLVHRPAQEGTTMPTLSFPLREGDRVQYTIAGDHRLSGPLRPSAIRVFEGRLVDSDTEGGTFITESDRGTLDPAIGACDLVERHGLPVEVHEIESYGVCIIYITLQDIDGMYYMHAPDLGTGEQNQDGLTRCGIREDHPIRSDTTAWDWLTARELDEAGVDYSEWPTPLRYGNDQQTGDRDVDEVADALQVQVAELEQFKRRVARVAMEYGRRHNMCRVVRDGLRELGIAPADEQEVTITFTMKVKATPPDTADANVTADDVQRALTWDGWDAVKVREKVGLRLTGWKVGDVTLADPVVTDVHPVTTEEVPF